MSRSRTSCRDSCAYIIACKRPNRRPCGSYLRDSTPAARTCCYNFLYGFKGAPRRAGPDGLDVKREGRDAANRGSDERPGWPAVGGRGQIRGSAVGGRQLSSRLRTEALRRAELPRPAAPVTGRVRYPPYRSGAAPISGDQTVRHARAKQSPEKSPARGRNAAHCPGRPLRPQGHPKILSNRSAERIFRTHPCRRSLWRPSGPDGKGQATGQAQNTRGEPALHSALSGNLAIESPEELRDRIAV
jgi:hypothetical protein